jgi:hypothetical protein
MRMAAVFAISTTMIATRLRLAPRWLTILGLGTGIVLLFSVGIIPWTELLFPAWVFIFSLHILVASFRVAKTPRSGSEQPAPAAAQAMPDRLNEGAHRRSAQ